ncbi:hypothetical protein LQZ18_10420 [Lachnospiraceae bacterium ZAX-1]
MARDDLKLEVVRQYYIQNLNQGQIAKNLDISRSYVSKLLIEARQEKLVEIKINSPYVIETKDENLLRTKYCLKKVIIVAADDKPEQPPQGMYYKKLGNAVNEFLNTVLKNGDTIGVAWGKTIYECSKMIKIYEAQEGLSVVSLCGGVSQFDNSTYSNEILNHFTRALNAKPYALPLPAIAESKRYKDVFVNEQSILKVMQVMENINVALFTVGRCDQDSALVRSGYITEQEMAKLVTEGAVGEVCTHFVNEKGVCFKQELEDRTIAVSMDLLKKCETRIAVILGEKRLETLKAILYAEYINVLIIDEEAAKKLLSI